jgi:hypothetical protein
MYLNEVGSKIIRCRVKVIRSLPETSNAIQEAGVLKKSLIDRNAQHTISE